MWGEGYMYVEEDHQERLAEGDYYATISDVKDNENLPNCINVIFKIKDHPYCTPFLMTLWPRPVMGQLKTNGQEVTDEDCKKWDRTMSRFFDAFEIKAGNFTFNQWKGHSAWLTCKKNKNNDYSSLFVSFDQRKEKKAVASGDKVTAAAIPSEQKIEPITNFEEDIPFDF